MNSSLIVISRGWHLISQIIQRLRRVIPTDRFRFLVRGTSIENTLFDDIGVSPIVADHLLTALMIMQTVPVFTN
jgi:hypothetical protein